MARKVTGGAVGEPSVGAIQVAPTAVVTAADNQNITLSPTGTGSVVITNNTILNAQSDLRFADADSSNYVAFQGASTIAANVTWTLPSADGTANQAIVTNASGVLSFATPGPPITDNNSDSGTNYISFTTLSSGTLTATRVATTTRALTYQPSTGTLVSTIGEHPVVQGGTGSGTNLVLRSTTNATKGQVYIDETTAANSTTTGALRVGGGMGVAGTGYFAGVNTTDLTASGTITFTGPVRVQELVEDMVDVAHSSNVIALDYTAGNIFFLTNTPGGSMTVNISNVPTTDGRIFSMNLFVTQGSTGYNPTVVNINGGAVTLKWPGGTVPTPTSSSGKIDVYTFTILRRASGFTLLGAQSANF